MKRISFIILRVLAWIAFGLTLIFICAILVLNIPSVQTYVIQKITGFVSGKTHTKVSIERVNIGFPRSVHLQGLFAEDKKRDTLVYLGNLEAKINLFSLLKKEIYISKTEIEDLRANIYRPLADSSFNFQFLIDAFVSKNKVVIKDTSSKGSPWTLSAGDVTIERANFNFNDSLGGNMFYAKVQYLDLEVDDIDLQRFQFEINSLKLAGASGGFTIARTSLPSHTVTSKSIPLFISAHKIELENIDFRFINTPDQQNMRFQLGKSLIENSSFDLASLSAKVGRFDLSNSKANIAMVITTVGNAAVKHSFSQPNKSGIISNPQSNKASPFNIDANNINLQNIALKLDLDKNLPKDTGIDFQHLQFPNISLKAKASHYHYQNIKASIESFTAKERSGVVVNDFSTDFIMDTVHAEAKNLYLATPKSKIKGYASLGFASWQAFSNVRKLKIDADVRESVVDLKDILPFAPNLTKIDIIRHNLDYPIRLSTIAKGTIDDIAFHKTALELGKSTAIHANGHITGLPAIEQTDFDIQLHSVFTGRHDLDILLPSTMLSAFHLPDSMAASGSFKGSIADFKALLSTHTSDGNLQADVAMQNIRSQVPAYQARLATQGLNIGKILKQQPLLGKATLQATIDGKGFTRQDLNVVVNAKIDSAFLNKYTYSNLNIKGNFKDRLFNGHADMHDPNLDFTFDGKINMNTHINQYTFVLDIQGADLQNLKLTNQDIRLSAVADANIKAPDFDKMNGKAGIKNIVLYSKGKKYEVDSLLFVSFNDDKRNRFEVNSAVLKAKFEGNIALASLPATISNHFNHYFKTGNVKKGNPEHFSFEIDIDNSPLIYEVIIPNLKNFVPGTIKGSFDSESQKLDFDANMLNIEYAGNRLENFVIGIHSNPNSLDYSVGLDQFSNSQMVLQKTSLSGSIKDNKASINLSVIDKKKKNKLNIQSQLTVKNEWLYHFNILPKGFVINDETWHVPDSNYIEIGKNTVYLHEMNLENDVQKVSVQSSNHTREADLHIKFDNFQLLTLSQIVEKDQAIARGKLDGSIVFKNYHKQLAFVSDLTIDKAQLKNNDIGTIVLKADNLIDNKYSLSAAITGNSNDILLKGYLQGHAKGMNMDLDLRLNKVNLTSFQGFVSDFASNASGFVSGDLKLTGETADPQINGGIELNKAAAQVSALNQYLTLDEGKITIDPNGIYFPNLVVYDTKRNAASIKGSIGMQHFKDFKYMIDVETDHFIVMNSTKKNNKMLNGRMIVSSKIKLRGDEKKPDIHAKVKLEDGSNICFTVPENQLSADKGEGVVAFDIDTIKLNPIIRKAALQRKMTSDVKGINLASNIEVNSRSTLKLVLDPTQSDTLIVNGDANLSFALDESGKMSLVGTYIIASGSYELTLQDIINKKFLIQKGSSITWYGDPLDALIDIKAQYNVRTSPADLLTSGNSGKADVDPSAAKNALNFFVQIFIKGQLLKPDLKFGLDMDPTQQSALGGTVYAKLTQLNTNESELDKQVFSLLVIGSFMPNTNATGGGTDYNGIARSSASSILSSQLNNLSAQYIKGVELNFDLQSYNDYASGQKAGNTQLSVGLKKQFFDNKLSVQVGSNVGLEGQKTQQNNLSNFTGNIVIEYKLTKDGNYKLKAFRQNQYEGLVYGVVIKTGAGILYSRDYNTFKEIFKHRDKK